ncbi:predicted protein [Histoplasma mississippiense (nom. inval.)]|uniref:predicted protein n=1 Tax=Ajellomyces capsulatus (strain NAm1 / WU24) TaxID=2059318 RepID=UPI000157B379|nr:predicted protein [Histoplasma mississippiense (nom. inval.)]EDN03183.1 predicted protein [Histoplasma mississippiense (nom. inval.)]
MSDSLASGCSSPPSATPLPARSQNDIFKDSGFILKGQHALKDGPPGNIIEGMVSDVQTVEQSTGLAEYEIRVYGVKPCFIKFTDGKEPRTAYGNVFIKDPITSFVKVHALIKHTHLLPLLAHRPLFQHPTPSLPFPDVQTTKQQIRAYYMLIKLLRHAKGDWGIAGVNTTGAVCELGCRKGRLDGETKMGVDWQGERAIERRG